MSLTGFTVLGHVSVEFVQTTSSWSPCQATSEILPSWIRSSTGSERNFGAPRGRKLPATEGFHPPRRSSNCLGPSRFVLENLTPGRKLPSWRWKNWNMIVSESPLCIWWNMFILAKYINLYIYICIMHNYNAICIYIYIIQYIVLYICNKIEYITTIVG